MTQKKKVSVLTFIIRSSVLWVFTAIYFTLATLFAIVTLGRLIPWTVTPLTHYWGRICLKIMGCKYEIEGSENLLSHQKGVIIFNHSSTFDAFMMAAIFPKGGSVVAKREFIFIPFFNIVMWSVGFLFLPRGRGKESWQKFNKYAGKILAQNRMLLVAPEGTRSRDGLLPFKKGAFYTAMTHKVPMQMIVLLNNGKLWPRNEAIPIIGTLKAKVLPPFTLDDWTEENMDEKIAQVRNTYAKELS